MSNGIELKVGGFVVPLDVDPGETDLVKLQDQFRAVFENEAGAAVLGYLCRRFFFIHPTYTLKDPKHTEFQEGNRFVVNSILYFLSRKPEELERVLQQNNGENP